MSFPKYFETCSPLSLSFVFPALIEVKFTVLEKCFIIRSNDCRFYRVQGDKWKLTLSPNVRETVRSDGIRANWGVHAL